MYNLAIITHHSKTTENSLHKYLLYIIYFYIFNTNTLHLLDINKVSVVGLVIHCNWILKGGCEEAVWTCTTSYLKSTPTHAVP